MEFLRYRLSNLRSKWAALQFPNLRSLYVTDVLTMDKQVIRVIHYVFIAVNNFSQVALYEAFIHCVHYRYDACRVVLRFHPQQSRWRSCRGHGESLHFCSTIQFQLLVIYFIVYLFCAFLYALVFSQLFACFTCVLYPFPVSLITFFYYFLSIP